MSYKEIGNDTVNRWTREVDAFKCVIDEKLDGLFYVYYKEKILGMNIWGAWEDNALWFPTYQSARNYLKKEYDFSGRMKKNSIMNIGTDNTTIQISKKYNQTKNDDSSKENKKKEYEDGYLQGRLDEAETTYRNILSIMDDMIEEPTGFTIDWINELEEFLKENGRLKK
ncbi:hypothetical protein [Bacillus mycoides]|uniref:hypothetical protein n=1 Tax=Bacillus mycoides TaxID=1405 RepID=UPI003D662A77